MSHVWGRFDDLRVGVAHVFPAVTDELVATSPEEVAPVLDEVDRVTRAGRWAFGFVAYEAAAGLDPALAVHRPVEGLPLAWFGVTDAPRPAPVVTPADRGRATGPWECDWSAERHGEAVTAVQKQIAAGETYQCNLTTRFAATMTGEPLDLYRDLAPAQRGAHNAFLDLGRFAVVSASPELFAEIARDHVLMRPMKGTAARGRTAAEDEAAARRLRASAKDRAENVMIVDLVRNDLARVAVPGTVRVPVLCRAERFETVHQLTSDVTARLRPDVGLTEVFRALFPCGSVTGAPKVRTAELITELEDGPRGVYCGAVGVVAPPGAGAPRARFSVAIRTVLVDRERGTAVYGSGGGITWDSDPAAEYAELLAKARVLDVVPRDFHLVETMRHVAGRGVASLDAHLDRVAASAGYFGFRFDRDAVRAALDARLADAGDATVRLLCHRDGGVDVEVAPLPAPLGRPVRLVVDDEPVDSRECWPHHKTSRRLPYTSRRERHPEADDVLLVNERGEITEASTANVAVRLDGRWWTPPLGDGCLPGVERARLVAAGELTERVLRPADLARAGEIALVNALRGWRAAVLVTVGTVTT